MISLDRFTLFAGAAAVCCLAAATGDAGAAVAATSNPLRIAALSDDSLPGVPTDVGVEQFSPPVVHGDGLVVLRARLAQGIGGTTPDNDTALWIENQTGVLEFVVREGDDLPGSDLRFLSPSPSSDPVVVADGLFFSAELVNQSDPVIFGNGVFRYSPALGLEPAVLSSPLVSGVPTVGAPGDFINNDFQVNRSGDLVLQTGGGFGTIWSVTDGDDVSLVDLGGGSRENINDRGQVAFRDRVNFPETSIVVWDPQSSETRIVATEGQIAPGAGGAAFGISRLGGPLVKDSGAVSFVGGLVGSGVDRDNDYGVWSETTEGGPLRLDLREGDPAIGLPPEIVWSDFTSGTRVGFSNDGGVALNLGLSGPGVTNANDSGVWAGRSTSRLRLVAREGDPAPGVEDGLVLGGIRQSGAFPDGRGALSAFLQGDGLDPSRNFGVWAEDVDGALRLIARRGDTIKLPSGETVELTSLNLNFDLGLGELGHLGILAGLSNGQQAVLVSDAVAIPESASLGLLVIALVRLAARRRQPIGLASPPIR